MDTPTLRSVAITVMLVTLLPQAAVSATDKPNVVFIVADDLGWNDVGYNNPDIISPNIDALATEGVKLTHSYVQPLCSPSRSAFMTGQYPYKLGLQHLVILPQQNVCVPLDQTFMPQVFKDNGYRTHAIGKWHLDFCQWECTPTYRGFDTFLGYYNGAEDYYAKVINNGYDFHLNQSVKWTDGQYSTFQFADRAKTIIEEHDPSKPLFLYLPFQSVHTPLEVPKKYEDMYPSVKTKNRKALSGMVTAMDEAIGQVVQALKDKDMYDNTLIAFSADNGGMVNEGGNNYPLRGGKATIFEGGTRVPGFMHGSMLQKKAASFDGLMHAVDWFPTLMEAAGLGQGHINQQQDGVSQWSAINTLDDFPRTELIYNLDYSPIPIQGRAAIRVGDYKLIEGFPGAFQGWYKPDVSLGLSGMEEQIVDMFKHDDFSALKAIPSLIPDKYLFNLKDDPEERNNLYFRMPKKVKELRDKMNEYAKAYVKPNNPPNDPGADLTDLDGVWVPGWC